MHSTYLHIFVLIVLLSANGCENVSNPDQQQQFGDLQIATIEYGNIGARQVSAMEICSGTLSDTTGEIDNQYALLSKTHSLDRTNDSIIKFSRTSDTLILTKKASARSCSTAGDMTEITTIKVVLDPVRKKIVLFRLTFDSSGYANNASLGQPKEWWPSQKLHIEVKDLSYDIVNTALEGEAIGKNIQLCISDWKSDWCDSWLNGGYLANKIDQNSSLKIRLVFNP